MRVAVTVAGHQQMVFRHNGRGHHLLLHILGHALFHEQLGDGGIGAHGVDVEHVLMAVHRIDQHLLRIAGGQDSGHVAISLHRHLQLLHTAALDVVAPCGDLRVHLTSLGVFVGIKAGISGILLALGLHAPEHLERILLHGTLVKTNPTKDGAIGIETECLVKREFLFVNPVGDAIDDLVELPVFRDLHLGIVIEQLHDEDVAFAHESHLITVGRPCGHLLGTASRKLFQLAAMHVVDVIFSGRRMAIHALGLGLNEHPIAVGRHDIPVKILDLGALRVFNIKQHTALLPRLERVLNDAFSVIADAGILVSPLYGIDAINALGGKLATGNRLQIQSLGCPY